MTDLSPAANAVWEAFNQDEAGVFVDYGDKLAAALQAVADQVLIRPGIPSGEYSVLMRMIDGQVRAIAAELEAQP